MIIRDFAGHHRQHFTDLLSNATRPDELTPIGNIRAWLQAQANATQDAIDPPDHNACPPIEVAAAE